jgi:succinate dehydrogenase / fumarate reductase, iron-sulfur subunit
MAAWKNCLQQFATLTFSHLFSSAKIAHLNLLPQGQPERTQRVLRMVQAMDHEGFGNCTMHRECEAVCPKEISVNFIARLNRECLVNSLRD